jgi:hypothetical protein
MLCSITAMFTTADLAMYDARIMNQMRRTTVAASAASLATLEAEADRRGVSLTAVIAEAIEEKAEALRARRRPRVGIVDSQGRMPSAADLVYQPEEDWRA